MVIKQLTDEEIQKMLAGRTKKKGKDEEEFSEVTLCVPGKNRQFHLLR